MSSSSRVAGTASLGCIGSWQPGHMTRGKVSAASVLISRPISQGRSEHPIYGGFSTRQKCDLSATHVFARQQPRYFISRSGQGTYHGGTTQLFSRIRPTEFRLPRGRTAGGASSRTNRRRPALAGTGLSRKGPRGSYRLRRASATCDSPRPQATFAGTRRQKLS